MKQLNDFIYYINGINQPLSSGLALIKGKENNWFFDVGNGEDALNEIKDIENKTIVLSHFHPDHISNLRNLDYKKLYVGDNTYKYTNQGEIVNSDLYIEDGYRFHIFPISNCHAKGSLGLQVNNYCFIGDSLAPTYKKNKYVYNAQLLKNQIDEFMKIDCDYFIGSHNFEKIMTKQEVISRLLDIYNRRSKDSSYIEFLDFM